MRSFLSALVSIATIENRPDTLRVRLMWFQVSLQLINTRIFTKYHLHHWLIPFELCLVLKLRQEFVLYIIQHRIVDIEFAFGHLRPKLCESYLTASVS